MGASFRFQLRKDQGWELTISEPYGRLKKIKGDQGGMWKEAPKGEILGWPSSSMKGEGIVCILDACGPPCEYMDAREIRSWFNAFV